jgi:hypothetical protein
MKKIIIAIFILTFSIKSFAQIGKAKEVKDNSITIGEVKDFGTIVCSLKYVVNEKDTTYFLMYRDVQYKTIVELKGFYFTATNDELNSLYSELIKAIDGEKNKSYELEIGKGNLRYYKLKSFGVSSLMFFYTDKNGTKSEFFLYKNQIKKLFGKEEKEVEETETN